MILRTIHFPTAYDPPNSVGDARYYYSGILQILSDALVNCVLLVDEEGQILQQVISSVESWPHSYRISAEKKLRRLRERKRIVKVSACDYAVDGDCSNVGCQHAAGIASSWEAELSVTPETCTCRDECLPGARIVTVCEYQLSAFHERRSAAERCRLRPGEWAKERFHSEILRPVFRFAKHVKVIDRHIGRQFTNQLVRSRHSTRALRNRFEDSLEWLFECFMADSRPRDGRTFEIICGLQSTDLSDEEMAAAATELCAFAARLTNRFGLEVRMTAKAEALNQELPHARYLITDQIALLFDRGFDLVRHDGTIRDVEVIRVDSPGEIEADARQLSDVSART
jgi:hypothetical protein